MPPKKTTTPAAANSNDEGNKYLNTICYLGIFWLVPLALGKKNETVQWHAKQGIVLSLAWFLVMVLSWIPLFIIITFPATILLIVINVLAILKTWRGEKWELPFLAQYVKTLNL